MSEWIVKSIEHLLDFSNILNASIAASWMVLAVIVLRFLLKKAPRWIHVALWGLVAVRLLLPFSIESSLSLIPSAETIPHELLRVEGVQLQEPAYLDVVSNPIFTNGASVEIGQTIDRVQINMLFMTLIWLTGIAVLLIYTITSYWYLRRKVREAVILRDSIFQSENAGSPFVLGIIKPRIYLPYKIEEQTLVHVIAHEQAHIQRKDHWWKPLGFLLLTIHWFNPLMWLGYVLLCRDIELACDEKVIKNIDNEQRANYSQALVACSVKRPMIAACPLAFGEVGVKERVKTVLNYKKPAFWIIVVAVVACIVIAVCFLTNPKTRFTVPENSIEKVTVFHATVNDGMSRELSPAQISEMVGRFSGINRAKRSEQYAGFTPGYQLCLFMKDGSNIYANGYNFADNSKVEIVYDGKRYAITDDDFSKYLINICAGNDTTEAVMVGNATKWFDCLHGDEMVWDGMREINLDEFPGVTFRAYSERIEAVTDKETVTLYTGMPIWSVYFCDLTGDGLPELCSSLSFGSGIVDNRVMIYDYANGVSYSMEDRGVTDYILRQNESDGQLYVDKKAHMGGGLLSTGRLVFEDDCLQVLWPEKPNGSIREITDPTDDPTFTYDTAVEKIFEDENNEYFIGGLYSQHIIVYYTDGTQEDIVTALNAGRASIVDLDKFGIRYWAEPKGDTLVQEIKKIPGNYDFDHDGISDTLEVVKYYDGSTWFEVMAKKADDSCLWKTEAHTAHAGNNSIFVCTLNGRDYILQYSPSMFQGSCDYAYTLFSLDAQGAVIPKQSASVSFDINWGVPVPMHEPFDAAKVADFMDGVNGLLANSKLVLSTDSAFEDIDPENPYDIPWWIRDKTYCSGYVYDYAKTLRENLFELEKVVNN